MAGEKDLREAFGEAPQTAKKGKKQALLWRRAAQVALKDAQKEKSRLATMAEVVEAATEEKPPAEEPDLLKPADFEKRLRDVRAAREEDLREVSDAEPAKEDSLAELGADLSSKVL